MSETKFTKGNWKITTHPSYPEEKRICGDSEEIAIIRNLTTNAEANTKLIAASPSLLEGCRTAKAIFQAQGIDSNHKIVGKAYKEIEDAIEKATF